MRLFKPFFISSRLRAAIKIGGATIDLEAGERNREGRTEYAYSITLEDGQCHEGNDLASGCLGGSVREGFESLLDFLSACGESVGYSQRTGRQSENADLFPAFIGEWAAQYSDELSLARLELEENPGLIEE